MSFTKRMNRLVNNGFFPTLEKPPFQSSPVELDETDPTILPLDTYRLFIGTGGDLQYKMIGDDEFRLLKNIPDGTVIEGMFHEISATGATGDTTASDIVAFHLPLDPAEE